MEGKVTYVAVSKWLAERALRSKMVGKNVVKVIPNSISLSRFPIKDKIEARDHFNIGGNKKIVVFGAARIDAPIKGFEYLKQALRIIAERKPEMVADMLLMVFGGCKDETVLEGIAIQSVWLGKIMVNQNWQSYILLQMLLCRHRYMRLLGRLLLRHRLVVVCRYRLLVVDSRIS